MARTKELTVEDRLKVLYELQQVDTKIDNLRTLAGELPQSRPSSAIRRPISTRLPTEESATHANPHTHIPTTGAGKRLMPIVSCCKDTLFS